MIWSIAVSRFFLAALVNSSTSSFVGGSPVMSKLMRRSRVRGSAGRAGAIPAASNLARMKRSMSVFAHREFFTFGGVPSRGAWKAQCWRASGGGSVAALTADVIMARINPRHVTARCRRVTWPGRVARRNLDRVLELIMIV